MVEHGEARQARWRAVRLVAVREIVTRMRTKAFRITTAIAAALILAGTIIPRFVDTDDQTEATIGVVAEDADSIGSRLRPIGEASDLTLEPVFPRNAAEGEQQVRDGDIDVLLLERADRSFTAVTDSDLDPALENALSTLVATSALDRELTRLGGDPEQVRAALANAQLQVTNLEEDEYEVERIVIGAAAGLLIYMAQLTYGQTVAQGVVEEKSSRIVELLLSTIRPWQLLAGKVLGIGAVGLIQMVTLGVIGLGSGLITGALTISVSSVTGILGWVVVWFVLGFFVYALAFAAAGALVSRQEDIGAVVTPIMMVVIVGFVVGISVLPSNPGSALVRVMSLIPVFSPTLMPMRLAIGGVPLWEAALSVALVSAMIPVLVWFGGTIYRNAVLRTGVRVKLSEALSAD